MIKRVAIAAFALILALAVGSMAGCGSGVPDDAVAKIGDTLITEEVFNARVAAFAAQSGGLDEATDPEGYAAFKVQILGYLVTYEVASQKAEELGVPAVTDEDVQAEIDSIVKDSYAGDQAAFEKDLVAYGYTMEGFKQTQREYMLLDAVFAKVTENVTTVPDEDISAYYDENKASFFQEEKRDVRHILIAPGTSETSSSTTTTTGSSDSSDTESTTTTASTTTTSELTDADWAAALAIAENVRALLVAGGDWTELAAEYSDDAATAEVGGEYGAIKKGYFQKEFEDSAFSLKQDDISQPIKTLYGYHIIQVTGITEAKQLTLDEAKDQITSKLLYDMKEKVWNEWLEKAKAELGVTYREDFQPTTTTTAVATPTTADGSITTATVPEDTTTTAVENNTTTTAKP